MTAQIWTQHDVAIVGVGTTRQGVHPGVSVYQLGLEAVRAALDDAGIEDRSRVDGLLTARQLDGSGIDPVDMSRLMGMSPRHYGQVARAARAHVNSIRIVMIHIRSVVA